MPRAEEVSGRIDGIIQQSMDLSRRLQALDHAVSKDRAYLNKTELRAQRGAGRGEDSMAGLPGDVGETFKPL